MKIKIVAALIKSVTRKQENEVYLVEILQEGDLLLHEELSARVRGVFLRPEGADVNARGLGDVDQWGHAPEQGPINPHQVLGRNTVRLVEDEANLGLAAFHLPEEHLQLPSHVQLGGVKHQEDKIGSINEPLAHLVVRVT